MTLNPVNKKINNPNPVFAFSFVSYTWSKMSSKFIIVLLCIVVVDSLVLNNTPNNNVIEGDFEEQEENVNNVFDGVYSECFLYLSYSCLQRKTLLYLKEINKLSEVSVIGDYVKFGK